MATTDDNLKDLYDNNITILKNRITDLINLADRNQKQTVIAQQLTDINTKVERVKILTGIGKITFSKETRGIEEARGIEKRRGNKRERRNSKKN